MYNVSFWSGSFNNIPAFSVQSGSLPAGVLPETFVAARANDALAGSFRVRFGSYCESVTISLDDAPTVVAAKLATLPNMRSKLLQLPSACFVLPTQMQALTACAQWRWSCSPQKGAVRIL